VGNKKHVTHPTYCPPFFSFQRKIFWNRQQNLTIGGAMSNYRRAYVSGGTYFFTVVTYRRQHLFHDEIARHLLNHAIAKTRQNYPLNNWGQSKINNL